MSYIYKMNNRILNYIDKNKFNSEWNIWYHHNKKCWKVEDYKKIFSINTIEDYWNFFNNISYLNTINSQHFFMMRRDIKPTWEDINNKKGGCWSIKTYIENSFDLWIKLSSYIVGETLVKNYNSINGISICTKNENTCIIKIWNNDYKQNSINLLPKDITDEFGYNIIYKAHIPEY